MVSLGLVGEVFEVRTQVDRDLTTVSRVDRQLRLIKNLGRHTTTLVQWLRWMAGSYVGRLGTKMASSMSARLNT
jgi:hypothetical protein